MEKLSFPTAEEACSVLEDACRDMRLGDWTLEQIKKLPVEERLQVLARNLNLAVELILISPVQDQQGS